MKNFILVLLILLKSTAINATNTQDRAIGSLLGLAIGDAVGTTLEFSKRDQYKHITDMIGGGPFNLNPGEWTDDTSMALCLADSLIEKKSFDPTDLMLRFSRWMRYGYNSSTGFCFDIGITTKAAIIKFEKTSNPFSGSKKNNTAGNGSIMRLAPVAIYYYDREDTAIKIAKLQSKTTHGALESIEASALLAKILINGINGKKKSTIFNLKDFYSPSISVQKLAHNKKPWNWQSKSRKEIKSSGYVMHTLEAAIWCVFNTNNFKDAILMAANLGDDADTVAAVTGQIAGSIYGKSNIPTEWLNKLYNKQHINNIGLNLFNRKDATEIQYNQKTN